MKEASTMKEPALTTIFTAEHADQAEEIIGWLRAAGIHPAELGLTAPVPLEHSEPKFPIEVPSEEAERARSFLESRTRQVNAQV